LTLREASAITGLMMKKIAIVVLAASGFLVVRPPADPTTAGARDKRVAEIVKEIAIGVRVMSSIVLDYLAHPPSK